VGLLVLCFTIGSGPVLAQACLPPADLRVCQDVYGDKGRVFLVWTNAETPYTKIRLFRDGRLEDEAQGNATLRYIESIPPGPHSFAVEGVCGNTVSARATTNFTTVTATPHSHPVDSMECSFDPARRQLTATLVLSKQPSLFIDVYIRRAGVNGLLYVKTVQGTSTAISVDGALSTDRLRLQFFDKNCYGSDLIGCLEPACLPVVELRVCQDLYGASPRAFLAWLPNAVDYTSFEIFLDGAKIADVRGNRGLFYVDPITPGQHSFGIRGICGTELTEIVSRSYEILGSSPHSDPVRNLHCDLDEAQHTLTATWLRGSAPSEFIDVYVRHPGESLLDFAGTVPGDRTRVRVKNVMPEDQMVLQFFNTSCYGSPLLSCGKGSAGSRDFLRGDGNGSGKVDLSDAVFSLAFLFLGDLPPLCFDATDANDDGKLNIADAIFTLSWLFGGGPIPPPPGPLSCGADATADTLPACLTAACE
jgi:hypothetical protein